jgi:hypothetical protein
VRGVTLEQIDKALAGLRAVLHRVEHHYWKSTTMYADTITPLSGVDSLVFHLFNSVRAEEDRYRRLREGNPLPDDFRRGDVP